MGRLYTILKTIASAMDIEATYNYPADTRAWLDGFKSISNGRFYNFGSCDNCGSCEVGCPPNMPNGWTYEDIWYVSWGALPAYPLPEIYTTNGLNSNQWYVIDLYSVSSHGNPMNITGVFTQFQACSAPCNTNTPSQGWNWLFGVLNTDSRTRQELYWSTDITYQ